VALHERQRQATKLAAPYHSSRPHYQAEHYEIESTTVRRNALLERSLAILAELAEHKPESDADVDFLSTELKGLLRARDA
jgi:hypothetical protein